MSGLTAALRYAQTLLPPSSSPAPLQIVARSANRDAIFDILDTLNSALPTILPASYFSPDQWSSAGWPPDGGAWYQNWLNGNDPVRIQAARQAAGLPAASQSPPAPAPAPQRITTMPPPALPPSPNPQLLAQVDDLQQQIAALHDDETAAMQQQHQTDAVALARQHQADIAAFNQMLAAALAPPAQAAPSSSSGNGVLYLGLAIGALLLFGRR